MIAEPIPHAAMPEARWVVWGRSFFAVAIALVLITLGIANVIMYSRWHEVEDGVLWGTRPEGVTAVDVSAGSAAAEAGIHDGDVLLAVNRTPVQTPADVIEYQHSGRPGTTLAYTLLRFGTQEALQISLTAGPRYASVPMSEMRKRSKNAEPRDRA